MKKTVNLRQTPFKLSGNKAGKLKKGASVKVVKGGRVEYDGITFYKVKLNGCCYWVNKNYLTK